MNFSAPKSKWTRRLMWAPLWLPLGVYILYVAVLNLALSTHLISKVASEGKGKSFNVGYSSAWTFWPSRIEIRNLKLEGTDPNVHWEVKIEKVWFRPNLFELFKKEFRVAILRGDGVEFSVRQHKKGETRPKSESRDPTAKPIKINVERVELKNFTQAKFDTTIFRGSSYINGGFSLVPGTELKIPYAEWVIVEGKTTAMFDAQEVTVLDRMTSHAKVTIHPADLTVVKGSEVFKFIDIDMEQKAALLHARWLSVFVKPFQKQFLKKSEGDMALQLKVRKGILVPDTSLDLELQELEIAIPRATLHAGGTVKWRVKEGKERDESFFDVILRKVELRNGEKLFRAERIAINGTSSELNLLNPFSDVDLRVKSQSGSMGRINELLNFFAEKKKGTRTPIWSGPGSFEFGAHLVPGKDRVSGFLKWKINQFSVTHNEGKTVLTGNILGSINLSSNEYSSGKFNVGKTKLFVQSPVIKNDGKEGDKKKDWSLDVSLENGQVAFADTLLLDGKLRLKLSDIKVPVSYIVPDNFFVDVGTFLFPMYALEGIGDFKMNQNGFFLNDFEASSKSGKVKAGVGKLKDEKLQISLLIDIFPVDLCVRSSKGEAIQVSAKSADKRCEKVRAEIKANAALKPLKKAQAQP